MEEFEKKTLIKSIYQITFNILFTVLSDAVTSKGFSKKKHFSKCCNEFLKRRVDGSIAS